MPLTIKDIQYAYNGLTKSVFLWGVTDPYQMSTLIHMFFTNMNDFLVSEFL